MLLIGITGQAGAGKDTASEMLEAEFGFTHISGGDTLRELLKKIDVEPAKDAVVHMGAFLRKHDGPDAVIRRALVSTEAERVVFSGFRSPKEAEAIQARGGHVVYIDASFGTRLTRIQQRARPGEDTSEEAVLARDGNELLGSHNHSEDIMKVRDLADHVVSSEEGRDAMFEQLRIIINKLI